MKQGYVFTRDGKMYVVVGMCLNGGDLKPMALCQEMSEGGSLVAWPLDFFNENTKGTAQPEQKKSAIELNAAKKNAPAAVDTVVKNQLQEPVLDVMMDESSEPDSSENLLEAFFDADTAHEKLELLRGMKSRLTEGMLSAMAISLDFELSPGDLDEKYYSFERFLRTRVHFEGRRPH